MKRNKLLLLLVLLVAAATGAWAQDAKHLITATYREQTRSLEQPLPYATTIGEFYEAVTGQSFSDLISSMSAVEMPLTGISSNNTSAVSIGELNGASTPVTVIADGKATIGLKFGNYVQALFVNVVPPLYVTMADGTADDYNWTASTDGTNFGELPIGGLKGDGSETVTLQYNGRLKVKGVKATSDAAPADPQAVPMTIEAITAGSINVENPKDGMQYSKNGGAKTAVTTSIDVAAGDKVQFYGNGTSITKYQGTIITGSGNGFTCKVYGNIMSLVDETGFATATTLSVNNTFYRLFYENTTLTDASGLLLPATELAPSCYNQMFMNCTALTAAPELPATTLVEKCYYRMFYNCTALTAAPELPATKLAAECYNQMFRLCINLTAAPELPATELASNCYRSMFMGCTALTTAPVLPATTLVESCYYQMFTNCTSLTTVPSDLPATTLVKYCYYQMFSSCTSLITAPVLPATTLVDHCYYQMFDSCSKLATVTCLATSGINQDNSTSSWLNVAGSDVQGTKTVYTSSSADWPSGNNGIPDGWTRVYMDN